MSISKRLLTTAAIASAIAFTACDNEDDKKDSSQMTKANAKAKISDFNNTAKNDLADLSNSDGLNVMKDLFSLLDTDDPFGKIGTDRNSIRSFFHKKGSDFKQVFLNASAANGKIADDEPFEFESNTGVYAWNLNTEEFERTENSDVIVIEFPSENSMTNNAKLTLKAYVEIQVYNEEFDEISYEPTLLNAELLVNNIKAASLYLEAEWTEDGFPVNGSIMANVSPFKLNLEFSDKAATSSYINISLLRNTETLIATQATIQYKNSSKDEQSLSNVEGFLQFANLKVQGKINVEETNTSEIDWSKVVNAALYDNEQKLGNIIFVEEQDGFAAYIQYADGSKEKLEDTLQPVVDELNALQNEFELNG